MVKHLFRLVQRLCLAGGFLLLAFGQATAADYYFNVTRLNATLTVDGDATVTIAYAITFRAEPGSHAIDIVDIGLPNDSYRLATAEADIDGMGVSDIRDSEYVKPGVEVHLGSQQILPGQSGTLRFSIRVANLIFPDEQDPDFASLEFKTTWFGEKYVSGNAERIEVEFILPEGTTPERVKFHNFGQTAYQPGDSRLENNRVRYRWSWLDQPASRGYRAGASFPRDLVTSVYSPSRQPLGKGLVTVLVAFAGFITALIPIAIPILIVILAIAAGRRRQKQYLPPKIGIETGGIKRGLTPPEAALLQELPLPKVLLLIIFGMLKKGTLTVKEVAEKDYRFTYLPKPDSEPRLYETDFAAAITKDNTLAKNSLKELFTRMIKTLSAKMEGFSRRETSMYYRSIMDKAWQQVRETPKDQLPQQLAENLEWLVMDRDYQQRFSDAGIDDSLFFGRGFYWYRSLPYRTSYGGSSRSGGGGGVARSSGGSISGAASRFVGAFEAFSTSLVGNPATFTAGITQVTNPPPAPSTSRGSGWHGGSSCACACACAGCACACAGGGR